MQTQEKIITRLETIQRDIESAHRELTELPQVPGYVNDTQFKAIVERGNVIRTKLSTLKHLAAALRSELEGAGLTCNVKMGKAQHGSGSTISGAVNTQVGQNEPI